MKKSLSIQSALAVAMLVASSHPATLAKEPPRLKSADAVVRRRQHVGVSAEVRAEIEAHNQQVERRKAEKKAKKGKQNGQ